jgi:hypothetical protein
VLARVCLILGVVVLAVMGVIALTDRAESTPVPVEPDFVPPPPPPTPAPDQARAPEAPERESEPFRDPFSYEPSRRREFEARAAAGNSHVLYALSPDGAVATANRVAQFRDEIDAAAERADVSADMLEGLVFLESAGRPEVVAPQGLEGAVGLTQILAETGTSFLGMDIDVARSAELTRRIARARTTRIAERLAAERRRVDPRFDPEAALAATGRYLRTAEERLGSEELAFVSYHMGIGNLEDVLEAYAGGPTDEPLRYAQVYFDSSPVSHEAAYRRLYALGDDSSNYLWKVRAAREIMRLYREEPAELQRLATLYTEKNSAEEVLHPADETNVFADPGELRDAYADGDLLGLPVDTRVTGLRVDEDMGELAKKVGAPRFLYWGLRPEALALALYIGAQVREGSGDPDAALTVTSTVRDLRYQAELVERNPEATPNYSLHTTGWAFDVLRRYRSDRQAEAFQAVLDRLRSLNLIAYVYEPAAIHITVSRDAAALEPLLDRVR